MESEVHKSRECLVCGHYCVVCRDESFFFVICNLIKEKFFLTVSHTMSPLYFIIYHQHFSLHFWLFERTQLLLFNHYVD